MKRLAGPILLMLLVSGCQSEAGNFSALPSPEKPLPINTELIQSPASVPPKGLTPGLESSRALETATPIETAAPETEPAVKQTEEISLSASPRASLSASPRALDEGVLPTEEPAVTPTVTMNGIYEETFFRGRDSAPVTMIDYSDFL